ncbi:hypothetical protein IB234_15215 [Pseudomonas sp. PDM16]|uniref:hypothetical protein n=1 Tax=Pseudomonas sp. PDM16 TaxID=2769292 RepID=UPI00177E5193|nr:hypothetical protein [Pseudomonas sp. PDM16]MBD9415911.1 hypothetical protein [Pseudomonas sp. PDM16]
MRLISARQAWHDCMYQGGITMLENLVDRSVYGQVQFSEFDNSLNQIAHQALAGRFQAAIASLPVELQCFGHNLYAPEVSTIVSNNWEEVALALLWESWWKREQLAEEKQREAYWVASGVLYRYRRMVQGGMGNPDPLESPRLFRGWLQDRHGLILDRRNWSREWGWIVQELFRVCDMLDRRALQPLSVVLQYENGTRSAA